MWQPDILGDDFQARTIELGADPEGEGAVCATLVRYLPTAYSAKDLRTRPAILWVPGMTDYFFHRHAAEEFFARGYAFYALDLRKCGRSRRAGQRWHYSSDFSQYFKDLDAAVEILRADHPHLVPLAHSTGALICALWLNHLRQNHLAVEPVAKGVVKGMILNSPWLDMMYPKAAVALLRPLTEVLGAVAPTLVLPGGNLSAHGISISKEWDFDTTLKPINGHVKHFGWLREVMRGQRAVQRGRVTVQVPILTLCSTRSLLGQDYSPAIDSVDAVVDVAHIKRLAPKLGADSTVVPIPGARHDVFLSTPTPRAQALDTCVRWLEAKHLSP